MPFDQSTDSVCSTNRNCPPSFPCRHFSSFSFWSLWPCAELSSKAMHTFLLILTLQTFHWALGNALILDTSMQIWSWHVWQRLRGVSDCLHIKTFCFSLNKLSSFHFSYCISFMSSSLISWGTVVHSYMERDSRKWVWWACPGLLFSVSGALRELLAFSLARLPGRPSSNCQSPWQSLADV